MPLRLKDIKFHEAFIANNLLFVHLCVLVSLWQKSYFAKRILGNIYKQFFFVHSNLPLLFYTEIFNFHFIYQLEFIHDTWNHIFPDTDFYLS
jgi:hypothetical protein